MKVPSNVHHELYSLGLHTFYEMGGGVTELGSLMVSFGGCPPETISSLLKIHPAQINPDPTCYFFIFFPLMQVDLKFKLVQGKPILFYFFEKDFLSSLFPPHHIERSEILLLSPKSRTFYGYTLYLNLSVVLNCQFYGYTDI